MRFTPIYLTYDLGGQLRWATCHHTYLRQTRQNIRIQCWLWCLVRLCWLDAFWLLVGRTSGSSFCCTRHLKRYEGRAIRRNTIAAVAPLEARRCRVRGCFTQSSPTRNLQEEVRVRKGGQSANCCRQVYQKAASGTTNKISQTIRGVLRLDNSL